MRKYTIIRIDATNEGLKRMRFELRKKGISRRVSGQIVMDSFDVIYRNVMGQKCAAFLPIAPYADLESDSFAIRFHFI
jgi:hypothetical protein